MEYIEYAFADSFADRKENYLQAFAQRKAAEKTPIDPAEFTVAERTHEGGIRIFEIWKLDDPAKEGA